MKVLRILIKIVLPLLILALGFAGMRTLVLGRPAPRKEVRATPGPLVEVLTVQKEDRQVEVRGTGIVQASREVGITPQVSGRLVKVSPSLVAGGFFRQGDVLFEVESADYELGLERARATLTGARYELTKMKSQAEVARVEWEQLDLGGDAPNPLVLYGPQLENARAAVAAAEAAVQQAKLDLGRTTVRAPFNCRVRSEQVEVGQYVRSGNGVAVVTGTDMAEVVVPLPLEDLRWLRVPRQGDPAKGSPATVSLTTGNREQEWKGRIVRTLGEVDPRGRMTRIVVEVEDPYGLHAPRRDGRPDLELGMFVDVALHGTTLPGVIALPRRTIRDGSTVWVVDEANKLKIHPVEILRMEHQEALIAGGLTDGARVVVTALAGAVDGMTVRPVDPSAEGADR